MVPGDSRRGGDLCHACGRAPPGAANTGRLQGAAAVCAELLPARPESGVQAHGGERGREAGAGRLRGADLGRGVRGAQADAAVGAAGHLAARGGEAAAPRDPEGAAVRPRPPDAFGGGGHGLHQRAAAQLPAPAA